MEKIALSYLGDHHVKVDFSYCERLKDVVKSTCVAKWFKSGKIQYWYIKSIYLMYFIGIIKANKIPLYIEPLMQLHFFISSRGYTKAELDERALKKSNDPSYATKSDYNTEYLNFRKGLDLYPYQKAGLVYAIANNGRVLFADSMGLGKTAQAIAMFQHFKSDLPVLIVAPSSLLYNWKKEILMWLPHISEDDILIIKKGKQMPSNMITICGYDYPRKKLQELKDYLGAKGIVIIDEAHNIKNPMAKRTKAIMSICHIAKKVAMITGTPILSRPKEVWTILNSINPFDVEWSSQEKFEKKYCEASIIKIGKKSIYQANGASNAEEFHDHIRAHVMIRRSSEDDGVLDQLPKKRRVTQYLDITKSSRVDLDILTKSIECRAIQAYKQTGGKSIRQTKTKFLELATKENALDDIFRAYKMTGMVKVDAICDWLSDKLNGSSEKFIIFGHHRDFLKKIINVLSSKKIRFIVIDGATTSKNSFDYVEEFQTDKLCRVAILSIMAASVGITMTAASEVVMGEFPWTPAMAQQAECRSHRNGQTKLVNVYYMIANNTIDGYLWNMLVKKSQTSSLMFDDGTGDEMKETIGGDTLDILDAVILSVHERFKTGKISL